MYIYITMRAVCEARQKYLYAAREFSVLSGIRTEQKQERMILLLERR